MHWHAETHSWCRHVCMACHCGLTCANSHSAALAEPSWCTKPTVAHSGIRGGTQHIASMCSFQSCASVTAASLAWWYGDIWSDIHTGTAHFFYTGKAPFCLKMHCFVPRNACMQGCHVLLGFFFTGIWFLFKFCSVDWSALAIQILAVLPCQCMRNWETANGCVQSQLDGGTKFFRTTAIMTWPHWRPWHNYSWQ